MLLSDQRACKWCHSILVELVMVACYYGQMLLSIQTTDKWCHNILLELDMVACY